MLHKAYTVVISSVGRVAYLCELIDSIRCQTLLPASVIILFDDNSHCRECAEELKDTSHSLDLKVLYCKGLNLPSKRNLGASIASTDIVIYSDDDDLWMPEKAASIVIAVKDGFAAVCHNFSCFGACNSTSCSPLGNTSRPLPLSTILYGDNIYGGGSSISCLRSLVLAIPFDETLASCEDLDWWFRVQISGASIFYIGSDLVSYRRHETNMGRARILMSATLATVAFKNMNSGCIQLIAGMVMVFKSFVRLIK